MVAAEARFRNCANKEAEIILSQRVELLSQFEAERKGVRHG